MAIFTVEEAQDRIEELIDRALAGEEILVRVEGHLVRLMPNVNTAQVEA